MWKRLCWNEMIISLQCDYNNDVYDGDLKDIGPLDSDEYAPECHSMALPVGRVGIQGRGLSDWSCCIISRIAPRSCPRRQEAWRPYIHGSAMRPG